MFVKTLEPNQNNDVSISFKLSGFSCQIPPGSIPILNSPYAFQLQDPVLGLSKGFVQNPNSVLKQMSFPFLIDMFHPKIKPIKSLIKCSKCHSYVSESGKCCFCEPDVGTTFWCRWPREMRYKVVIVFVIVGTANEKLLMNMWDLNCPMIVMSYDGGFVYYRADKGRIGEYKLIENCSIPETAIVNSSDFCNLKLDIKSKFISRVDLNEMTRDLLTRLPNSDPNLVFHIIISNSLPHKCLTGSIDSNYTCSLFSTNMIHCDCADFCLRSGGHFLPSCCDFRMEMSTVISNSVRFDATFLEEKNTALLFPGTLFVQQGLKSFSSQSRTVQIVIDTENETLCFTASFSAKSGVNEFLYAMATPSLLLTESPRDYFTELMKLGTHGQNSINIPHSLKYFLLFPPFIQGQRTINSVITTRPFVMQIMPTIRPLDMLSGTMCTSLSILMILYMNAIYIWIGGDIKEHSWRTIVGVENGSRTSSFELEVPNEFDSILWQYIRSIRKLMLPYKVPVIVVPSESGRRSQIVRAMDVDYANNDNILLQRYADLIRTVVYK